MEGRGISTELEALEEEIKGLEEQEKEITSKVEPTDLINEGNKLKDEVEAKIAELEKIGEAIEKAKMDAIPPEIITLHRAKLKEREDKEKSRNKVALKVQKIKDRLIPAVQKELIPKLDMYEDIETVEIVDGKAVAPIFDHLETWKANFKKKKV